MVLCIPLRAQGAPFLGASRRPRCRTVPDSAGTSTTQHVNKTIKFAPSCHFNAKAYNFLHFCLRFDFRYLCDSKAAALASFLPSASLPARIVRLRMRVRTHTRPALDREKRRGSRRARHRAIEPALAALLAAPLLLKVEASTCRQSSNRRQILTF